MGKALRDLEKAGHPAFYMRIDEDLIPSPQQLAVLGVIEDVVMVGYPQGLADEAHGFPIFRHGYTASHPVIDFDNKPWGALDIPLFAGSSGSPVVMYRPGEGYAIMLDAREPLLLGVLFGGPQARAEGFAIDPLPSIVRTNETFSLFMNIGYYVKAQELLELREAMLRDLGIDDDSSCPGRY
jgi:hypothetical protein